MHSTMLYLRSQPLRDGDVYRLVVYPATSPYLATLTVADRSSITIAAGTYPALKLDLQLSKIGKEGELEPHKKFRHASLWVSDDSDRILLRVEASIFVGTVFAELQSITFPERQTVERLLRGGARAPPDLTIRHPFATVDRSSVQSPSRRGKSRRVLAREKDQVQPAFPC